MKLVTILFLHKDKQLLLAMKKRGFGEGKWNGVGGKVDAGESIEAAAIRECQEEIGVTPIKPKLIGKIKFYEKNDKSFGHYAHVFVAEKWEGVPVESDEMRPQWFDTDKLPFESMWADDPLWLPLLIADKLFVATFTLDGDRIHKHDISVVSSLPED